MTQKTGQEEMTDLLTTKNLNVSFKSRGETIHAVKNLLSEKEEPPPDNEDTNV